MKTTLNQIRSHGPCVSGWNKLLKRLGKTKADDEELSLLTVLDRNGLLDTSWCLEVVEGFEKEKKMFAVFCARQVRHLMADQRSIDALGVAERYCNGGVAWEEAHSALETARVAYTAHATHAAYAAYAALRAVCATVRTSGLLFVVVAAADAAETAMGAARFARFARKEMIGILAAELRRVLTACGG